MTAEEAIKTLLGRAIDRISELEAEVAELRRCRAIADKMHDEMTVHRVELRHAYMDLDAEKQRLEMRVGALEVELDHAREVIENLKNQIIKSSN